MFNPKLAASCLCMSLALSAAFPGYLQAGEQVDLNRAASNDNRITIENLRGKVAIIGWDQSQISIKGELDDSARELRYDRQGDDVHITVVMPESFNNSHNNSGQGSDLVIHLPRGSSVEFNGVSSDVSVRQLHRNTDIETVSGEIHARELKDSIRLSTVSGDITTVALSGKSELRTISGEINDEGSSGEIRYNSVSGDIEAKSSSKEVRASVVSGDMVLQLAEVIDAEFKAVNGDLNLSMVLAPQARLKVSSVNGHAKLQFADVPDAHFKISSSAGGRIINRLTDEEPTRAKYGPSSKLRFTTGRGQASVKVTTINGRIELSQQ